MVVSRYFSQLFLAYVHGLLDYCFFAWNNCDRQTRTNAEKLTTRYQQGWPRRVLESSMISSETKKKAWSYCFGIAQLQKSSQEEEDRWLDDFVFFVLFACTFGASIALVLIIANTAKKNIPTQCTSPRGWP